MSLFKKDLIDKKITRPGGEIEPEEIFWDAFTQKKESTLFQKKLEVPLRSHSPNGLRFVFFVLVLAIFAKVLQWQILENEKFSILAERNKFVIASLEAQRGVIYDRNFEQLVSNRPSFNLVVNKDELSQDQLKREDVIEKVAWILETTTQAINEKIDLIDEEEILIVQGMDYQKLILFESNIDELKGFSIDNVNIREYKEGPISAHVIGYYRASGQSTGLEQFYNDQLSPELGEIMIERDVYGEVIAEKTVSLPEAGNSLVLWLDARLQEKISYVMARYMQEIGAKKGVAVAMDPNTGGVLALVSFPNFDNNLFSKGITEEEWDQLINDPNKPFLNRVIAGKYVTGSTIKPLIAAAALEEGIISEQGTINCEGKIVIDNPWFPDKPFIYHDWQLHGITDIKKAIARSCNVFFYTIGGGYKEFDGLGVDKIKKYLELFGWSKGLGIDLPGEEVGFIPDEEWKKERFSSPDSIWMPGDTYNLSIGQGFISATPLEVVASFVAIANDGELLQPQIVQKIIDKDKKTIEEFQPRVISNDFISQEHLKVIKQGMRGTVTYGTALSLSDLPVSSAAKTGTAETSKQDRYHNWLTVFAPYEDPEIVLTLMIEDVPETYSVVLPTAHDILNWYFSAPTPLEQDQQDE